MPRKKNTEPPPNIAGRSPLKNASAYHIALCLMKVTRQAVTLNDLKDLNPVKFRRFSNSELNRLVERGFAISTNSGYVITQAGIQAIYDTAHYAQLRKKYSLPEDD